MTVNYKTLFLLNSSVITNEGIFSYKIINEEQAHLIYNNNKNNTINAIGHQAMIDIASRVLNVKLNTQRLKVKMNKGDGALVFKLSERLPITKELKINEFDISSLEIGLIVRIS
ncbi:MAG: DUF1874 domain-containing protein [Bacteroidetes bacterium]|nr:DUF1874 domain-containing protein [Bacteroidota bacterium]